ncbi:biotin synthase [Amphibiibacter pelophylacis]|uniref:Biotin synthase n=1 Tax=Amphibiibacter pelophylacis TaxID=1799477 RepID=A0ACC6P089_9BURK
MSPDSADAALTAAQTAAQIAALCRQHQRLAGSTQAPWLAQEIATRMADRLSWLRQPPTSAAVWLADGALWPDESLPLLAAQPLPPLLWRAGSQPGLEPFTPPPAAGWRAVLPRWLGGDLAVAPPQTVGLLWSNLNLHHSASVRDTLARWFGLLADHGVLMFSTLGPLTARALQRIFDMEGWGQALPEWVDMHDWGDRLVDAGFSDPVVDQETLTLTYASAAGLLDELRHFWGNTHPQRFVGLRTPQWRQRLLAALERELRASDGRLHLTVEVVYGHAVKLPRAPKVEAETRVDLAEMRRQLRQRRSG